MLRISTSRLGIASGTISIFDHFEKPTPMWSENGARHALKPVLFDAPFVEIPVVTLSIALIDHDGSHNLRLALKGEAVSRTGFTARAETWGDTRIARLRVAWQAIGAVADPEEDWDI